jgi:hypothetical protein
MRALYPGLLGIACCLFVVNTPAQSFAQEATGAAVGQKATPASSSQAGHEPDKGGMFASAELPDSPGTTLSLLEASGNSSRQETGQSQNAPPPPSDQKAQPQEQQQRPVGTAAAEAPKVSGITAAQPAGFAIAPAKQRRVRTIVLRVGAIVGAGAALGTVIALTAATPSKPPGAH